jgi:hypothetical protein
LLRNLSGKTAKERFLVAALLRMTPRGFLWRLKITSVPRPNGTPLS